MLKRCHYLFIVRNVWSRQINLSYYSFSLFFATHMRPSKNRDPFACNLASKKGQIHYEPAFYEEK